MRHIYYKYWHQCSKSIYIGINADVTDAGRDGTGRTSEDRATQLLICEPLSFAICCLLIIQGAKIIIGLSQMAQV